MAEPRHSLLQVCGMRPAPFTREESWGVWLQAVPHVVPKPKKNTCSVSLSSLDIACGDRQQKGKLAFSWHVNFCSLGTKGGPSAHCVSHKVGVSFATNLCWISAWSSMWRCHRPFEYCPGGLRTSTVPLSAGPTCPLRKKGNDPHLLAPS